MAMALSNMLLPLIVNRLLAYVSKVIAVHGWIAVP